MEKKEKKIFKINWIANKRDNCCGTAAVVAAADAVTAKQICFRLYKIKKKMQIVRAFNFSLSTPHEQFLHSTNWFLFFEILLLLLLCKIVMCAIFKLTIFRKLFFNLSNFHFKCIDARKSTM
jgi:hypothetical protein